MRYKLMILLVSVCTICSNLFAQQTIIIGKVIDSETGSPMSYASIRVREKVVGVVASKQGEFTLTLNSSPDNLTLVISFVGFKTSEINLSEFIERKNKIIKLEPEAQELEAVTISEEKFDLNKFMAEVIKNYQSGYRTTSHIAQAYFQEQVSIKNKPVLLADGIGYSVYLGDVENQAARSNYKFFYEQVSVNQNYKPLTDYIAKLGKTITHRFGASDNLNNFRTFELNGPLSANGKKFKYTLARDSTVSFQGQACLVINFKGPHQSGWMIISEDNLNVWMIAYNDSENIWSSVYDERVAGPFFCTYDYFEGNHYLSQTESVYAKGDIIHWNKLKIVSQKFDKLELSEQEYWAINSFDRFTIGQGKESEIAFEPYNFSKKDSVQRTEFKEGFKVQVIDPDKNPGYKELLTKLRALF